MGYMRHHAIVVTSWNDEAIAGAHAKAVELLPDLTSPIVRASVNGYRSFAVMPDGSKEGWADSDEADRQRSELITHFGEFAYSDGSSPLDWVLVQFSDEDGDQMVVIASDQQIQYVAVDRSAR